MDISLNNNINSQPLKNNFGKKLFTTSSIKNETKTEKSGTDVYSSIPTSSMWEKTKSGARKAIMYPAMALALATGGAATTGLTSCTKIETESHAEAKVDLSEVVKYLKMLLDEIKGLRQDMTANQKQVIELLTQLMADVGNYADNMELFYQKVIDAISLLDQDITDGNDKISDKLDQLIQQHKDKEISDAQFWKQLLGLVTDIRDISQATLDKLTEVSNTYIENSEKNNGKMDEFLEHLTNIDNKTYTMEEWMEVINGLGGSTKDYTAAFEKLSSQLDQLIKESGKDNGITLEQLEKLIKENMKDYQPVLDAIHEAVTNIKLPENSGITYEQLKELLDSKMITYEQLKELIEANTPDLSLTNELLKTISTQIKNLQIPGLDLSGLQAMFQQFAEQYLAGQMTQTELLQKIDANTSNLVTLNELDELLGKYYNKYEQKADENMEKITNMFDNVAGIDYAQLDAIAAKYAPNKETALRYADQFLEKLTKIEENTGKPNEALTMGQAEELIKQYYKDPTPLLEEMNEALKHLTNSPIINLTVDQMRELIEAGKADLSLTNELLKTISTQIKGLPQNADMSALQDKIDALRNKLNTGSITIAEYLQNISDALKTA